jgi:chromosome partitioning protein
MTDAPSGRPGSGVFDIERWQWPAPQEASGLEDDPGLVEGDDAGRGGRAASQGSPSPEGDPGASAGASEDARQPAWDVGPDLGPYGTDVVDGGQAPDGVGTTTPDAPAGDQAALQPDQGLRAPHPPTDDAPIGASPSEVTTGTIVEQPAGTRPVPDAAVDPATPTVETPSETAAEAAPTRNLQLPRTLAIANQKGGVGKTTTAVNLGAALADIGYRVLVVDLDPQGNATTGLGVDSRNLSASIYDVLLTDTPMEDCIEPTAVRNLFVVPATIDLAGAEIELVPAFSRELRLRRAIDGLDGEFDFTLIDCPPSLGLLTVNGLAAADEVLVPIQCEYYALEGLGQLIRNIQLVQSNLNPRLAMSTIVLTMYDARTRLGDQVVREVRQHFGAKVCRTVVPRTVRLSEAPSFGQPIIVFDPSSRGATAYRELAKEVSGGAPRRAG